MEQQDSIQQELQNLSRLQSEQVEVLRDMSAKSDSRQAREDARMQSEQMRNLSYGPTAMYNAFNNQMMSANPFDMNRNNPYAAHIQEQFGSSMNNVIGQQGRYSLLGTLSPSSRDSIQARNLTGMTYGSSVAQAGVAAVGSAASLGLTFATMKLPLVASLGAGMLGSAAISAYVNEATDEMKKNNALSKYLYKNSGLFMDSKESSNPTSVSGFTIEQSNEAANFVRTMNTDFYMKDEEVMTLLQKYTEGGLLKDVNGLDSFKEKMKSLTKSVKEGALMLNETYDSIADLMADMKKAGIDEKNFNDLMGMSKVLSGITGENGSDIIRNFTEFIKSLVNGTSIDATKVSSRLTNNAIYVDEYYNQLEQGYKNGKLDFVGRSNYNYIKNLGGPTAASEQLTAALETIPDNKAMSDLALSFFDWNGSDWQFNSQSFANFKNSNYTVEQLEAIAQQKLQSLNDSGQGNATLKWQNQAGNYIRDSLTGSQLTTAIQKGLNAYTDSSFLSAQHIDESTVLKNYFGITDSSMYNLIKGTLDFRGDNPSLENQYTLQNIWQQRATSKLAETPSFKEIVSSKFEKVGDSITQWAVDLDSQLGAFFTNLTTKRANIPSRYDTTFNTQSDLKSISFDDVVDQSKKTNDLLASGLETLEELKNKGYSIDKEISEFVQNKYNTADKTVSYGRETIANWDEVAPDVAQQKDSIISQSEKTGLSETIVAALTKYASLNTEFTGKVDVSQTIQDMGKQKFNYGGNEELALAASLGMGGQIDTALQKKGYNMKRLRSAGAQEAVQGITLADLGLTGDTVDTVYGIQSTQIGTKTVVQSSYSTQDLGQQDLRTKSNVTADDLNKIIESRTEGKYSKLSGQGQAIINAADKYGVDATWILAMMGEESAWGTSNIAIDKNNFFGYGAYDSSPYASAYSYANTEQGIDSVVKSVVENYFNKGQETLEKMVNNPDHAYNSDPEYVTRIAQLMNEILTETNRGYNGETGSSSVETKTEEVTKDVNGNNATQEQKQKSQKETWAEEGINVEQTDESKGIDNFLKKAVITSSQFGDESGNEEFKKLNEYIYNPDNSKLQTYYAYKYGAALIQATQSGKYSSAEDVVSQDYKTASYREKYLALLNDSEAESNLEAYEKYIYKHNQASSEELGSKNYNMLKNFGETYLNLNPNDYLDNLSEYNSQLYGGAKSFFDKYYNGMVAFYNGDKSNENYKVWESVATADKSDTIQAVKYVGEALGLDTSKIDKMTTQYTIKDLYSKEDIEKEKHLREDEQGNVVYDATFDAGERTFSADRIETWQKQGAKRDVTNEALSALGLDGKTTDYSTDELINKTKEALNKTFEQNAEYVKQANDYAEKIKSGQYGFEKASDEVRQQYVAALQSGNVDEMRKIEKENGLVINVESAKEMEALAKSISEVDASGFKDILSALQQIKSVAHDVGQTAELMKSELGSDDVFGSTWSDELDKKIETSVEGVLGKGSQLKEKLSKGEITADDILTLLSGGTVKGIDENLTADELQQISEAVSSAITSSFSQVFDDDYYLNQFTKTSTYQVVANENADFDASVQKIRELNEAIEEFGKGTYTGDETLTQLQEEKQKLVDSVSSTYQETIQKLGKTNDDLKSTAEKSQDSAETFSKTMKKYDKEIGKAIDTMDTRIANLEAKQTVPTVSNQFGWTTPNS